MPRRRTVLGTLGTLAFGTVAGCLGSLDAEETITREYDLREATGIRAETTNGEIEFQTEQRDTVSVDGNKRATDEDALDDVSLNATNDGDALSIVVETSEDGSGLDKPPRIDLTVTVPEELSITADSTNGLITAELGRSEAVSATATNGDIDIDCQRAASFDISSTNGTIDVTCETASKTTVETTNSDIAVQFPSTAELALDLDTQNGEVTVGEFDAGTVAAESSIEADIGSGTTPVEAETTNGEITLEPA